MGWYAYLVPVRVRNSGWVTYRSWRRRMKACKVDDEKLAEWIDGATGAIPYLGPAVTEKLSQKILAAE